MSMKNKKEKMCEAVKFWLTGYRPEIHRLHLTNTNLDGTHCDVVVRTMAKACGVMYNDEYMYHVKRASDDMTNIMTTVDEYINDITANRGYVKGNHVIAILCTAFNYLDTDYFEKLRNDGHIIWSIVLCSKSQSDLANKKSAHRRIKVVDNDEVNDIIIDMKCLYYPTKLFKDYTQFDTTGDMIEIFNHLYNSKTYDNAFIEHIAREGLIDSLRDWSLYSRSPWCCEFSYDDVFTDDYIPTDKYNVLWFNHYYRNDKLDEYVDTVVDMIWNNKYSVDCDINNRCDIVQEEWRKVIATRDLIKNRIVPVGDKCTAITLPASTGDITVSVNTPVIRFIEIDSSVEDIPYFDEVTTAMVRGSWLDVSVNIDLLLVYDKASDTVRFLRNNRGEMNCVASQYFPTDVYDGLVSEVTFNRYDFN